MTDWRHYARHSGRAGGYLDEFMAKKAGWVLWERDESVHYHEQMPGSRFDERESFPVLGESREIRVNKMLWSHITVDSIYLKKSALNTVKSVKNWNDFIEEPADIISPA